MVEDKEAVKILLEMIKKYPLNKEEKEAVSVGAGVLAWTFLSQSRIKNKKIRRDQQTK